MKAISLWQPWATAIALGSKRIETRSWPTSYRGPLAIHAAKRCNRSEMDEIAENEIWIGVLWSALMGIPKGLFEVMPTEPADPAEVLPFGAIVAVCRLVGCCKTESFRTAELDAVRTPGPLCDKPELYAWTERMLGDFSPGRFGWVLEDIQPVGPIPYKGEQGLFEVPDRVLKGAR